MADYIDEVMGFNPADVSAFNEPVERNYNANIYKTNPKDAKSESGNYLSKVRIIYNPTNPKDSIVHRATYFIKDTQGGLLVKSRLGNGPSDPEFKNCPLFKAWKKLWFDSENPANKERAKKYFDKTEEDYVLVQILEDINKPDEVGKFKAMKLPTAIKDKLAAKMNPSVDSKKVPYPVMDYVIGLELNMEVTPGPDDPSAPERKQREISYNLCEFGDYAPIVRTDGESLFDDEQLELIDSYATAFKDSTSAKTEAKKKAAQKQLEELRPQLKELYKIAYDYVKENCGFNLREEVGYTPWDENTEKRVNNWIKVVLAGKNPETTTVEDLERPEGTVAAPVTTEVTESPVPTDFPQASDDLPF